MEVDRIDYEILEDGTCSYCGRAVGMVEMPDGTMDWHTQCPSCEAYNEEEFIQAVFEIVDFDS
jgi:hypothetical protein